MTEQKPTETAQQVIRSLEAPFRELLEFYGQLEISMNSIANRQLRQKKDLKEEFEPIRKALDEVFDRLDAIERTIYEDSWARRTEGSNG